MRFNDVRRGIESTGVSIKSDNVPNFWKDLNRRGAKSLNRNWPESVFRAGFTGADAIGSGAGACFSFVPVPAGQVTPFVDDLIYTPMERVKLQSLSMPRTMKALGRPSENWQAQVANRLNVVTSFFALCSPRNVPPRWGASS